VGRLTRRLVAGLIVAAALVAVAPLPALGFSRFGTVSADATYGESMTFTVGLPGGPPDRLELLLQFGGDDATFVAPVEAQGSSATYVWDASTQHVTPNTSITYSWRATDRDRVTLSRRGTLLYDDDRPGLDWQSARLGAATVHWYGNAESIARRFGELAADGASAAETLLGHEMTGPIDIFVYDTQEDFFGALGPGAREWTGAATYPAIRTIFMWLGAGPTDYLETAVVHEVTHVVFNDATENPFHEPAKWFNEGLATWAEQQNADSERSTVEFEASGGGLFSFDAISLQFPISDRGSRLAYAQGATMVDMIIAEHGRAAIAGIAAAYRDGASDDEALQAGTGMSAADLYREYFASYGVSEPQPVEAAPILPSNVRKPGGSGAIPASSGSPAPSGASSDSSQDMTLPLVAIGGAILVLAAVVGALVWAGRRRAGTGSSEP
jgi:hypothetical protein